MRYTSALYRPEGALNSSIRARAWVAAVMDTTKLGTEEQDRLTLLPSARSTILFPLGQMTWSTWLLTFSQVRSAVFKLSTSTSVLLWPMLHTIQPFFILSMLSLVTTFLFPVAVMTMSTFCTTSDNLTTWNPSMQACRAQMGSISVTKTTQPMFFKDWQQPFPTWPYPHTTTSFPPNMMSVVRLRLSKMDSLQEYRLSYLVLITLSFTFIAGTESLLLWLSWYNLCTPVTLSSTIPLISLNTAGYFFTIT